MTSGYLWNPTQTASLTGVERSALNRSHPLRNFTANGPGSAVAVGFVIFNDSVSNSIPGITFSNGGSWDFQTHASYQNGAFFETFENWFFDTGGLFGAGGTLNFISMPSGVTNAGERNNFRNVRFGISTNAAISHLNANAQTILEDVSWNAIGAGKQFILQSGGTVHATDLHLESDRDTDYWISVSGTNSVFMAKGVQFVLDASKTTYAVAYSDATITWGVVSLRDVQLSAPNSYSLPMIAGTGLAFVDNHIGLGTSASQPTFHARSMNAMSDPLFASGSFATDGWTTSGGTPPVIDSIHPYSGANDAYFTGTGNLISRSITCKPGQQVLVQLQVSITNYNTGNFIATIAYKKADGTNNGSAFQFVNLSANTAYQIATSSVSGGLIRAPAGTVAAVLTISLVTGGTTKAYVGECIVTVA